jgi:hypothetical protein
MFAQPIAKSAEDLIELVCGEVLMAQYPLLVTCKATKTVGLRQA